jgi:hypothetical protein
MRIELGDMPIPHAREKPRYGATRAVKEAMQSGNGMDGCVPIMFAALFVRALGLFVASFVFGVLVIVALAVWAYKPGITVEPPTVVEPEPEASLRSFRLKSQGEFELAVVYFFREFPSRNRHASSGPLAASACG